LKSALDRKEMKRSEWGGKNFKDLDETNNLFCCEKKMRKTNDKIKCRSGGIEFIVWTT